MERAYWLDKWANDNIGFHEGAANAALTMYADQLNLAPGARLFLPLCGKTRDIAWLLGQGYRICGVELSKTAVEALFEEMGLTPEREIHGALTLYHAPDIEIYCGDIFDLTQEALGSIAAVYDRAALVALPAEMRGRYAAHLSAITAGAAQLLICYVYDQTHMAGPPFSVDETQIYDFYSKDYALTVLDHHRMPGTLKGQCEADQMVWLLEGETTR